MGTLLPSIALVVGLSLCVQPARAQSSCEADDLFFIGNSLTYDTMPWEMDCSPEFSIFCGKSLMVAPRVLEMSLDRGDRMRSSRARPRSPRSG